MLLLLFWPKVIKLSGFCCTTKQQRKIGDREYGAGCTKGAVGPRVWDPWFSWAIWSEWVERGQTLQTIKTWLLTFIYHQKFENRQSEGNKTLFLNILDSWFFWKTVLIYNFILKHISNEWLFLTDICLFRTWV